MNASVNDTAGSTTETEPVTTTGTSPASEPGELSETDKKKVASYLRFAKFYAEKNPEKSKEYAQKALDLAGESTPEGQEAKAILAQ